MKIISLKESLKYINNNDYEQVVERLRHGSRWGVLMNDVDIVLTDTINVLLWVVDNGFHFEKPTNETIESLRGTYTNLGLHKEEE
jgi:hypothetical protein